MIERYDELYEDICASVQKFCITELAQYPGCKFVDWDAHAEMNELPEGDLLGPAGIGMVEEGKVYEVVFSVGVSTVADTDLFRIRKRISKLFAQLRPECRIPIFRLSAGNAPPIGWMVLQSPTMITPMSRAETRVLQFVNAKGLLDPHLPHAE